jgi:hypothetical protein
MKTWVPLLCLASFFGGLAGAAAQDRPASGGVGIFAVTLFDPDETGHRGDLVILDVWEGSPAAAAGVQRGDVVVAIDGLSVAGKDVQQAFKEALHGRAGGKVHLGLLRPAEGLRRLEVELTRTADFPPRQNPAFETFAYTVPRAWRLESYSFPLPWSPQLAYRGIEDILFVPDFADRAAAGYHALVWVWWLDGHPAVGADMLRSTLLEYFRGLSGERGKNNKFTPQLDKVAADVSALPSGDTGASGGPAAATQTAIDAYRGEVVTYNPQGELITLQVDVELPRCPDPNHTAILFRLATRPREAPIWKDLQAVTSTFRCRRG